MGTNHSGTERVLRGLCGDRHLAQYSRVQPRLTSGTKHGQEHLFRPVPTGELLYKLHSRALRVFQRNSRHGFRLKKNKKLAADAQLSIYSTQGV